MIAGFYPCSRIVLQKYGSGQPGRRRPWLTHLRAREDHLGRGRVLGDKVQPLHLNVVADKRKGEGLRRNIDTVAWLQNDRFLMYVAEDHT
jgi:hypothetical protein